MCDPVRVSRWVAGELPVGEADALEAHLQDCAGCRDTARDLRRVAEALEALPILAPLPRRRTRPRLAWAGAAAAIAAAALGWTLWAPGPQPLVAPAQMQRGAYTVSVEGSGAELLSLTIAQDGESRTILEEQP